MGSKKAMDPVLDDVQVWPAGLPARPWRFGSAWLKYFAEAL